MVFHPLDHQQLHAIAKLQIALLQQRLQERDIDLQVTDEAMDYLAEAGFDPVYGARPLKRTIQNSLENPLAQDILAGKFAANDVVKVACNADGLVFSS